MDSSDASRTRYAAEAVEWNRQLDERLRTTGRVDAELLSGFVEAYNYDAATSVNWLLAKLSVLRDRLRVGETVHIEDATIGARQLSSEAELQNWIAERFPTLRLE